MSVLLRSAFSGDIPCLAGMHQMCFSHLSGGWNERLLQETMKGAGCSTTVIECEGQPAGFCLCREVVDEAEILTLCVDKKWQWQGLARQLVQYVMQAVQERGIGRMFLEVAEDNHPARELYRQLGFEEHAVRESYYPRPHGRVDAILMRWAL